MSLKKFKELFCGSPPHIKPVGFGVEIEAQIKNKKIKWTPFKFDLSSVYREILCIFFYGPRKKYKRIPFKFDLSSVYREILSIFFTFSMILKNPT